MRNILLLAILLVLTSCSSIRGSEVDVRQYLLTITPIGMPLPDLVEVAGENNWKIHVIDTGLGFKQSNGKRRYESYKPESVIGVKSVNGYLGHYQGFPFRVDVVAYWAIDENNNIKDIIVSKQYDAL